MINAGLSSKRQPVRHFESFEHTIVSLSLMNKKKVILVAVYRVLFVSETMFLTELAELFDEVVVSNEHFVIAGDINIHVETSDVYARQFQELLELYNVKQHIDGPTHSKGHTLDVVLTPNRDDYLHGIITTEISDLSDHFLIDFNLIAEKKTQDTRVIKYRPIKCVNMENFCKDVSDKLGALPPTDDLGRKVEGYNQVLRNIVDEYSPMKTLVEIGSTRTMLRSA